MLLRTKAQKTTPLLRFSATAEAPETPGFLQDPGQAANSEKGLHTFAGPRALSAIPQQITALSRS